MAKKPQTVEVNGLDYTMRDLKESLRAANDEAQGYMDQLKPLRKEVEQLRLNAENHERARTIILLLLGAHRK